jgi:hypothetical protein
MGEPTLLRLGSVLLVVGALAAVVVNVMHPRASDYQALALVQLVAATDNGLWIGVHIGILFAVLLVVGGQLALARSFTGERAAAFGRLGAGTALLSAAIFAVGVATDGFAQKGLADAWAAAPAADKAGALGAVLAVVALSGALFTLSIIVTFGLTSLLFGLAIASDETYPRWLGWIGVFLGVAATLIGVAIAYQGPSVLVSVVLFTSVSLAVTMWLLVLGVLLWRRAAAVRAPARAMA